MTSLRIMWIERTSRRLASCQLSPRIGGRELPQRWAVPVGVSVAADPMTGFAVVAVPISGSNADSDGCEVDTLEMHLLDQQGDICV